MQTVVETRELRKLFPLRTGLLASFFTDRRRYVHAVDGVSVSVREGEILGIAGESGSGKTTLGSLISHHIEPTDGSILFRGTDTTSLKGADLSNFRRNVQMIFQDPYESLDPRFTVSQSVMEPLHIQNSGMTKEEKAVKVAGMLEQVGLDPPEDFLNRFPHELSGGQRQRVAVARAMILKPDFLVADEPVSMLDVSIRSGILNLMLSMREEYQLSMLFITHDLAVSRYVSDRIAIMYLGKIVEIGSRQQVIQKPQHPYTSLLLSAVPNPDPTAYRERVQAKGEIPSGATIPTGCRFHTRCAYATDHCVDVEPELEEMDKGRFVSCHYPLH